MTVHHALRIVAPAACTFVAVASLLGAAGCSAPPGTSGGEDEVPEFSGNLAMPGNAAANPPAAAAAPPPAAPSGAGGSAGAANPEQTGAPGIGLTPPASAPNAGQNTGAGGSSMVGAAGGANPGAAGSSFDPGSMGAAGGATMPPPVEMPAPNPPPPVIPPGQEPPGEPVGTPPPPLNADCGTQFFCDGFEDVAAGTSPGGPLWSVIDSYAPVDQSANVQVSTEQARSGTQSVRVTGAQARNGIVATLPQNRFFMRTWLQVDAVPLGPVFIGIGTDQNSETRLRIQGNSFAAINTVGEGDGVRPGNANSGNCPECVTLTPDQWFCAEFFIDNAARTATLWIDGVEAAAINNDFEWPVQPAQPALFIGSMGLQGGTAGVFIDDVAAGPERIGCN